MAATKRNLNTKPSSIWSFTDNQGSFCLENPGQFSRLYFPLANEAGLLSNITPKLKGSIKISQDAFLTLPVSVEDLHSTKVNRNVWVRVNSKHLWSAAGVAKNKANYKDRVSMEAGLLWHKLTRDNQTLGIKSYITNFVPPSDDLAETMLITLKNTSKKIQSLEITVAIPIYARSADNLRDHRHVTSLLNRIDVKKHGVCVTPTMTFDERGHQVNNLSYAVLGFDSKGLEPKKFYPTVESFICEGGSFESPKSLFEKSSTPRSVSKLEGKEAMGAFTFKEIKLKPGETVSYVTIMGIANKPSDLRKWHTKLGSESKALKALSETKKFWFDKTDQIKFETSDPIHDGWLRWVGTQPTFRKIFGNSFLPDFDYGRGGRGWRDLWQDCLALLLTNPDETRRMILHNFAGVRIDGSNATIISSDGYKFIADRNQITRVWMDHGVWPLVTTELYIHESGDIKFLLRKASYFRDMQQCRGQHKDLTWNESYGTHLKTKKNRIYNGTLIEHLLVQHLVQFFNVGPHNHIRLENADWNDGLDMASNRGESVTFSAFYAGNLKRLANLLEYLSAKGGNKRLLIAKELTILLDAMKSKKNQYSSISYKKKVLDKYFKAVHPRISGNTTSVSISDLVKDLHIKADHMIHNIRSKEWIKTKSGLAFFNGYYDDNALRVEGDNPKGIRMTLTGQVFPIMSGIATTTQIKSILKASNKLLRDKKMGGVRLNTDFKEIQPQLGRAFSFAYGEKENGAFFNHMQVMYANALYHRGFVEEAYEVMNAIYLMSVNTSDSKIYPGLPEYFNSEGRGLYHYLTGSASWYFMTLLTESFGVRGHYGNLLLEPKLVKDQFRSNTKIKVKTIFVGKSLEVVYSNPKKLNYGKYKISGAMLNGKVIGSDLPSQDAFVISRKMIDQLAANKTHTLEIELGVAKSKMPGNESVDPKLLKQLKSRTNGSSTRQFKENKITSLPDWSKIDYKHL